jgi:hypothetical protein
MREWSNSSVQGHFRQTDRQEFFRNCEQELKLDFAGLREELVNAGQDFVISTDMVGFIGTLGGAFATGGFAAPALAVPSSILLARMKKKYNAARYKALDGHFTSYLYLAQRGKFEQDLR